MQFNDGDILALFRSGNTSSQEQAFRQLLSNYQERLYFHVRRYVSNHDDANDILQNTFIKVWKNLAQFRGDSSLYTWLYRIAGNEAITYLQKARKVQVQMLSESTANTLITSNSIDADEALQRFRAAVEDLPAKQKQVFILRYYDELSYEEMAQVTDTSIGALKASYHHAVKKIEEKLSA
jgi:RNA polymerase sigma factor (sigma-70 family)